MLFRRTVGLEEIPVGQRIALYRGDMEKAIILNRLGSVLWGHLETPQSRATLVGHLAEQFPAIGRERLHADVSNYLELLWSRGIILPTEE